MARVQAYLPDDLHDAMKRRGMSASKLLQEAVRLELRRAELCERVDQYPAELDEQYGPSTPDEQAAAEEWVDAILNAGSAPASRRHAS